MGCNGVEYDQDITCATESKALCTKSTSKGQCNQAGAERERESTSAAFGLAAVHGAADRACTPCREARGAADAAGTAGRYEE